MADHLYLEIKRRLLSTIREGHYEPGEGLPSIAAMARTFNASTKTVQKAINSLSVEGVVVARRGKGVFVNALPSVSRRSKRVGLLFPEEADYLKGKAWPAGVVNALRSGLSKAGYSIVPVPLPQIELLELPERLRELKLAGLVLFEIDSDGLVMELRDLRLPMVSMDYDASRLGVSSVVFDNAVGAFQATKMLVELGHMRIVFVRPRYPRQIGNNPYLEAVEDDRMLGYRIAMVDAGLAERIEEFPSTIEGRREGLLSIFGCRPAPTAMLCKSDITAKVMLDLVASMGFEIPRDLSIVGFGGTGLAFARGRRLATVKVDQKGMGDAQPLRRRSGFERRRGRIGLQVEGSPVGQGVDSLGG